MTTITFTVPIRTIANKDENGWARAKRRTSERARVSMFFPRECRKLGTTTPVPIKVTLTRLAPPRSRGFDEFDNLRHSMKTIVDQVALELGHKDDRTDFLSFHYEQRRAKDWGVEVKLEIER